MSEILFTKSHEWIKIEGATGTFGITDYAAGQLGDVTYIELPQTDTPVSKGDFVCEIESVKAASDIFSPLSGEISKVNEDLTASPELLNSSPQDKGWIARIKIADISETGNLLTEEQYDDYKNSLT